MQSAIPGSSTRRLANLEKPAVSKSHRFRTPKAPQANTVVDEAGALTNSKGRRGINGRVGKLRAFVNMPLDILFEITSNLFPIHLLILSRVSKSFREVFMSRSSTHAWIVSRRSIEGLPDCPRDLTEPEYARLLWEHDCHACGVSRAMKVDYSLRIRMCGPCFKENVKKGNTLTRSYFVNNKTASKYLYSMLPRSILSHSTHYAVASLPQDFSETNTCHSSFYQPEFNAVALRLLVLQESDDSEALDAYIQSRKETVNSIMHHAVEMIGWGMSAKAAKYAEEHQHASQRQADIETKLLELGWERKHFPTWLDYLDMKKWDRIVNQPRPLSDRIWKVSLPKLEAILGERKECILQAERDQQNLLLRQSEARQLRAAFLEKLDEENMSGGGEGSGSGGQQRGGLGADFLPSIFPPDFTGSVVNSLDGSTNVEDIGLFANHQPDNDLNFERDFAEWFTPNPIEDALIR